MDDIRLDIYLVQQGYFCSREKAKAAISDHLVQVNNEIALKPSLLVKDGDSVLVQESEQFVSRGAFKLLKAITSFSLSLEGRIVLDIGASTGGFTQVALLQGAQKVYAVDVGSGELAPSLLQDKRVVNVENQDFRLLSKDMCADVNMIIGDVSFISLRHIFPKIKELFGTKTEIAMLFKPQFECGIANAKKFKGVVRDKKLHKKLLHEFFIYLTALGFSPEGLTFSPIQGKAGNIEYLFHIIEKPTITESKSGLFSDQIEKAVDDAFRQFEKNKVK